MASPTEQKGSSRMVIWAVAATLAGLAMVVGGVYGVVHTYTDDDDKSSSTPSVRIPAVTPPSADFSSIGAVDDCEDVDPRLSGTDALVLAPVQSRGRAQLHVSCGGGSAFFKVDVSGADGAEKYLFAELWAYNSRKDAVKLGTAFYRGNEIQGLVGVPRSVDLKDYKSLVLVSREITDNSNKPRPIAFKGSI